MHVSDLLRLNGAAFVEAAYLAILKRQSDRSGLDHFTGRLASGDSKEAIIVALANSTEVKGSRIDLGGLPALIKKRGKSPLRRLLRFFSEIGEIRRQLARIEYIVSQQGRIPAESAGVHSIMLGSRGVSQDHVRISGDDMQNTLISVRDNLSNTSYDSDLFIDNFKKTIRSSSLFFVMSQ